MVSLLKNVLSRFTGASPQLSHVRSMVIPPQSYTLPGEPPKAREFFGKATQLKTSEKKLGLVAKLVHNMTIRDALIQLEFSPKKVAEYVKDTILDTQQNAVQRYQADPLNLYIAESFAQKGKYTKAIKYHGRGKCGRMNIYYAHYFVKLKEGKPPLSKRERRRRKFVPLTKRLVEKGPCSIPCSL